MRGSLTNYLNIKAARDEAKRKNEPYGNIFTTTPGYLSSRSGRFAHDEIYRKAFRWTEKLFDCADEAELYELIKMNTPNGRIQVLLEFNYRQLGYTKEWLLGKINDAMSSGENAGADFLNLWAEGSESSPIPKEILKAITASTTPSMYDEISSYGYITRWYIPEQEVLDGVYNRKLVMGLDTSDAGGKDDIAMVVRDVVTGETIAAGNYNETNLITFSDWIAEWLIEFDNIVLVPERRSSGASIIDNLLKLLPLKNVDPFKRIFNWVVNDCEENPVYMETVIGVPFNRRDSSVYTKYRPMFGFATSGGLGRQSRDRLYGTVFNASTKYTGHLCRDKALTHQLGCLTRKNGRIDHATDDHDDMVVAWLLGYWFLSEANNKSFYGINNQMVLAGVVQSIVNESGGVEAYAAKQKQLRLKAELTNTIDVLKAEKNPIISNMLKIRIKNIYSRIDTTNEPMLNIDAMIENLAMEKKKNMAA